MRKKLLQRLSLASAMALCIQPLLSMENTNPFPDYGQPNTNRDQVDTQQYQPQMHAQQLQQRPLNPLQGQDPFSAIPMEMKTLILNEVFISQKTDTTNFRDTGIECSSVCKDWQEIIRTNAKNWVCEYFNIAENNKDDFWPLFKGKLIYKPDPDSDEGRVDLLISALPNPLDGEFDLSECGDVREKLSINMGYRKKKNPENADKVEIWVAPWFLIKGNLDTTAGHFKPIMDDWKREQAPVGMFWTWGGEDDLGDYDYLTVAGVVQNNS